MTGRAAATPSESGPRRVPSRPGPARAGLLGGRPVRIRAEDDHLVAYGFAGQRIAIPSGSIGQVGVRCPDPLSTDASLETLIEACAGAPGRPLIVVGRTGGTLLRAAGTWHRDGDVRRVCQALDLPWPVWLMAGDPRLRRGRGYRRLRTRVRTHAAFRPPGPGAAPRRAGSRFQISGETGHFVDPRLGLAQSQVTNLLTAHNDPGDGADDG